MIHVLTPIRQGEQCADDLKSQSVECRRFMHSNELPNRRDNEALNRNSLKVYASSPHTLLLDADVKLTDPKTVEKMAYALDNSPYLAVAVDTKGMSEGKRARATAVGHTVIACLMIRREILDMLNFDHLVYVNKDPELKKRFCIREFPEYDKCLCTYVNARIAQIGAIYKKPIEIPYLCGVSAKERR